MKNKFLSKKMLLMLEKRTYLPNGMVITEARIQDVTEIADVVVAGSVNAYSSDEYISREGEKRSKEQIRHVRSSEFHTSLHERHRNRIRNVHNAIVYAAWSRLGIEGVGSGEINKFGQHELSTLYVREPGNGTGTALLDEVHGWQQHHGGDHSFLYVASFTPAVHLYEKKRLCILWYRRIQTFRQNLHSINFDENLFTQTSGQMLF